MSYLNYKFYINGTPTGDSYFYREYVNLPESGGMSLQFHEKDATDGEWKHISIVYDGEPKQHFDEDLFKL